MSTHTYAVLEVSETAYAEIRTKLAEAGYQHAFHREHDGELIDMDGIALMALSPSAREAEGTDRSSLVAEGKTENDPTSNVGRVPAQPEPSKETR